MKTKLETSTFGIAELASAFGVDVRLLKRRLNDAGHGALTAWTVRQSHDALAGDGSLESLRAAKRNLTLTQDEIAKVELAERQGSLVELEEFCRTILPRTASMVAVIESSRLTDAEKDALRQTLTDIVTASTPPATGQ